MTERTKLHPTAKQKASGKTRSQYLKEWPPEIPGRCNFRKPHHLRCKNYPLKTPGSDGQHCKKHQRKLGPEHHRFKGGLSDGFLRKHTPAHLLERFDAVVNNPELTSVRELLALSGARLSEVLDRVPAKQSDAAWDALGDLMDQLSLTFAEMKEVPLMEKQALLLSMMRDHYKTALHERTVWNDVHREMERVRRLSETERKREEMLQANLSGNQAIALFNQLFLLLAEEITDLGMRRRVGSRLMTLLKDSPLQLSDGTLVNTHTEASHG